MRKKARITNSSGNYVEVESIGAGISDLWIKERLIYEKEAPYNGKTIGRVANRTKNGIFRMNQKEYNLTRNEGFNHLHGGFHGFDEKVWEMYKEGEKIVFFRTSPDGEEGYPGNLDVWVEYSFSEENHLSIVFKGKTDQPTLVNLTNHIYFKREAEDEFAIYSSDYTTLEGEVVSVKKTDFDLRTPNVLKRNYDHNFVLGESGVMKKGATVYFKKPRVKMEVFTTHPGMQFYTEQEGSFCLEAQEFPNAANIPWFPSIRLNPGEEYFHEILFAFDI